MKGFGLKVKGFGVYGQALLGLGFRVKVSGAWD